MKLSTKIIAAVVLVAGSSGVVYAFSKHNHWHMTPAEKVEFVTDRVTKKLDLNPEQQTHFTALANTVAQILLEAKATKKQDLDEIETLIEDPSFNQVRALEMVQQKTQSVNDNAPPIIAALALFVDSLDAEQKQQLQGYLAHAREHHQRGRHELDK